MPLARLLITALCCVCLLACDSETANKVQIEDFMFPPDWRLGQQMAAPVELVFRAPTLPDKKDYFSTFSLPFGSQVFASFGDGTLLLKGDVFYKRKRNTISKLPELSGLYWFTPQGKPLHKLHCHEAINAVTGDGKANELSHRCDTHRLFSSSEGRILWSFRAHELKSTGGRIPSYVDAGKSQMMAVFLDSKGTATKLSASAWHLVLSSFAHSLGDDKGWVAVLPSDFKDPDNPPNSDGERAVLCAITGEAKAKWCRESESFPLPAGLGPAFAADDTTKRALPVGNMLTIASDGDLLLTGAHQLSREGDCGSISCRDDSAHVFLSRLSPTGELRWSKNFVGGTKSNTYWGNISEGSFLTELPNGDIFVLGQNALRGALRGNVDIYFYGMRSWLTSSDGRIKHARRYLRGPSGVSLFLGAIRLKDGIVAQIVGRSFAQRGVNVCALLGFNLKGQLRWSYPLKGCGQLIPNSPKFPWLKGGFLFVRNRISKKDPKTNKTVVVPAAIERFQQPTF